MRLQPDTHREKGKSDEMRSPNEREIIILILSAKLNGTGVAEEGWTGRHLGLQDRE